MAVKFSVIKAQLDNSDNGLRDYQDIAVRRVIAGNNAGIKEQLIELPTGCGKTVIAGAIANTFVDSDYRILFITHREEIIDQAVITIAKMTDTIPGIVKAEKNQFTNPIVLCSIQSLANKTRRDALIEYSEITVVIVDECHHFTETNSYGRFLNAVQESWRDVLIVGMSATPYRNDSIRITDRFEPVFTRSIERMQTEKWLANHVWHRIEISDMNIDNIPKSTIGGEKDFKLSELAAEVIQHLEYITYTSVALMGERQTVVFACNVEHMHELATLYSEAGIKTGAIWGDMAQDDRTQTLKNWRNKDIQLVVNVGVLTEGFDYPDISAVVVARPTMSPSLYTQMIGRGLRISNDKSDCLIIDYTGRPSLAEMGFTKTWKPAQITLQDILGSRIPDEQDSNGQLQERRLRAFETWSGLPFSFIPEMDSYVMSVMIDRVSYTFGMINEPVTGLYIPCQISNRKIERLANPTILRKAVGFMDEYLRRIGVHGAFLNRKAPWRKGDASPAAYAYLQRLNKGEPIPDDWKAGQVGDEITILSCMNAIRQFQGKPDERKQIHNRQSRDALIRKGVMTNRNEERE